MVKSFYLPKYGDEIFVLAGSGLLLWVYLHRNVFPGANELQGGDRSCPRKRRKQGQLKACTTK